MAIAYDITRLVTRVFNVTPNGIDRIDYALAEHFLEQGSEERSGIIAAGLRPGIVSREGALAAVQGIGEHWGELKEPEEDPGYRAIIAHLTGTKGSAETKPTTRIVEGRSGRLKGVLRWVGRYGIPIGRSPRTHLPRFSCYLNVSQFPLWMPGYFEWLEQRSDIRAVFFIHDLLPVELPDYFPQGEYERHQRRLANLARFGAAALVTSEVVRGALTEHLDALGRGDMPIFSAPMPTAPIFSTPKVYDARLAGRPYFVCCGTLEPRKNHLMLLNVWRKLVQSERQAPCLILVGKRGWGYDAIVRLLERSPALRANVIEVSGLTSPALKRLLDNACALLMPSIAEGYGLPVREALAAGVSVLASDIPAFREISDVRLQLLGPQDEEAWLAAICSLSEKPADLAGQPAILSQTRLLAGSCGNVIAAPRADATSAGEEASRLSRDAGGWASYFDKLDAFLRRV